MSSQSSARAAAQAFRSASAASSGSTQVSVAQVSAAPNRCAQNTSARSSRLSSAPASTCVVGSVATTPDSNGLAASPSGSPLPAAPAPGADCSGLAHDSMSSEAKETKVMRKVRKCSMVMKSWGRSALRTAHCRSSAVPVAPRAGATPLIVQVANLMPATGSPNWPEYR